MNRRDMKIQLRLFIGGCVRNWPFKRQRNCTQTSQRNSLNQMNARSYGMFPYKQTSIWEIKDQMLLLLIIKRKISAN